MDDEKECWSTAFFGNDFFPGSLQQFRCLGKTGGTALGEALKLYRNKVVIATKFGIHFDMESRQVNKSLVPDSRPEVIRASVENSLKRLGTDHIDLYYQHRVDEEVPIEEVAGVMQELIQEGKITHWGFPKREMTTMRVTLDV